MTSTVSGASTVYYTPYVGQACPVWGGSSLAMIDLGGELSQALSDATKSPAAASTSSNYDMFVWLDVATKRCTRGPAWSTATTRGTGAGTTELERVNGFLVNKYAITNGPAARYGTYVGSVRVTGAGTVSHIFGSAAAGGGYAFFGVWNAYNRVNVSTSVNDTSTAYTYTTAAWRYANAGTVYATVMSGLSEDLVDVRYRIRALSSDATTFGAPLIGIGLGSTTPIDTPTCPGNGSGDIKIPCVTSASSYTLGYNTFSALEYGGTKTAFAPLHGSFDLSFRI
jgi:hypothetical protein